MERIVGIREPKGCINKNRHLSLGGIRMTTFRNLLVVALFGFSTSALAYFTDYTAETDLRSYDGSVWVGECGDE